jgi:5-methylthioadenosine/S-adenosylhomocysteine deaminase
MGPEHKGADLLVVSGDVVTMNEKRQVLLGGAVAIGDERILAVGSTSKLRAAWPGTLELDASHCVVTPGLINAHQHLTGDPLARSCIPDDLAPGASIFEWSVPLHGAHTADDDELSAILSSAESALNGVTTLIEAGTVAHPERVVDGMRRVGVRGTIGTWGWDVEAGPFAAPAAEVLERQRHVLDRFPPGGTVTGWVTLVGHSLASDELFVGAAELARSRGVGMTMHMSPTRSDPDVYLARTGRRPIEHLQALGVLGPHLLLAHAVWLDDAEVDAVLSTSTAVAYCPWAYLRLGQGVTRQGRHAELFRRGGRVALGCDATNAGDQVDILRVAALAAGIAKDADIDPTSFTAHQAFEMATIRGAEAVGMGADIGSIEPGKRADLVIHDATLPQWSPRGDTALQLVWSADGRTVRDVLIDGRPVVRDRRCVTVDLDELRDDARQASMQLFARAGIDVPHQWPHIEAS